VEQCYYCSAPAVHRCSLLLEDGKPDKCDRPLCEEHSMRYNDHYICAIRSTQKDPKPESVPQSER